jgi:hypothetical protein
MSGMNRTLVKNLRKYNLYISSNSAKLSPRQLESCWRSWLNNSIPACCLIIYCWRYFLSSGKYIIAKVKSDFDQITQGIRVHVYKIIVAQLVENFPSSYGTRSFITFSFLAQIHSVSYLPLYSFQVYLNIILISMPRFSKLSFSPQDLPTSRIPSHSCVQHYPLIRVSFIWLL